VIGHSVQGCTSLTARTHPEPHCACSITASTSSQQLHTENCSSRKIKNVKDLLNYVLPVTVRTGIDVNVMSPSSWQPKGNIHRIKVGV